MEKTKTCEECVACTYVDEEYNYCEYYNDYFLKNDCEHICSEFEEKIFLGKNHKIKMF